MTTTTPAASAKAISMGGGAPERSEWQRYEDEKRAWVAANPGCTPQQYEEAMREITDRLGI